MQPLLTDKESFHVWTQETNIFRCTYSSMEIVKKKRCSPANVFLIPKMIFRTLETSSGKYLTLLVALHATFFLPLPNNGKKHFVLVLVLDAYPGSINLVSRFKGRGLVNFYPLSFPPPFTAPLSTEQPTVWKSRLPVCIFIFQLCVNRNSNSWTNAHFKVQGWL